MIKSQPQRKFSSHLSIKKALADRLSSAPLYDNPFKQIKAYPPAKAKPPQGQSSPSPSSAYLQTRKLCATTRKFGNPAGFQRGKFLSNAIYKEQFFLKRTSPPSPQKGFGGQNSVEKCGQIPQSNYLSSTTAPAASSFFLSSSASSLFAPSLTVLGAPSTIALAS